MLISEFDNVEFEHDIDSSRLMKAGDEIIVKVKKSVCIRPSKHSN
jgi:hypothetical protein